MSLPFPAAEAAYAIEEARGARLLGLNPDAPPHRLIEAVRAGLPFKTFERLQAFLDVPARELGEALLISARTLARRKKQQQLSPEESDRLLRLARLSEMAFVVFEQNRERAHRWMTGPKNLLGGESPLRRADTEAGAREVEDMLYALEFTTAA